MFFPSGKLKRSVKRTSAWPTEVFSFPGKIKFNDLGKPEFVIDIKEQKNTPHIGSFGTLKIPAYQATSRSICLFIRCWSRPNDWTFEERIKGWIIINKKKSIIPATPQPSSVGIYYRIKSLFHPTGEKTCYQQHERKYKLIMM